MKRSEQIQHKAEENILYFTLWWVCVLAVVAATIYAVNVIY